MNLSKQQNTRRRFLKHSSLLGAGLLLPQMSSAGNVNLITDNVHEFGKREGYTDQISILVSMMDWMRATVLRSVKGLSIKELDFLIDEDANSIGAMLLHLAATERYYQIHTFDERNWGDFDKKDTDVWDVPMSLGAKARKEIKGNPLSYYTDKLEEVREYSLSTLKDKDDSWLMASTIFFANQPTNNYCKWFHVVEHESNHNGQIKFIKSRIS
ncbi:MAG: DinB family protein [Flavobacteriaceae bacterium]